MEYSERYISLTILRKSKLKEYRRALATYVINGQTIITFDEVCKIREDLDDIILMLKVLRDKFHC